MKKKKTLKSAVIAVLVLVAGPLLFVSCGSSSSSKKLIKKGLYECDSQLQAAIRHIERRSFSNASRILEELKFQCGGSHFMDTVYYYNAISHFRQRQYDDARFEFEILHREFPRSVFIDEAHFRVAQIYYLRSQPPRRDQTETREAMRLFNDYLELFPKGVFADSARTLFMSSLNKLAEKEFNTALFYRRQKQHEAALIYYRSVLAAYPDSRFAPEAIVGMAEMLVLLGRTQDAEEVMEELDVAVFGDALRARIEAVKQRL
ncbi:MAG: outer membrane protein assembly factor BamD [Chitinispirillales bacterium]|nr:outer membrane protein assembly factor BamD [Chitinispirillales bacterium]